jgi:DNA-binding NarL/FixJ family response regulator
LPETIRVLVADDHAVVRQGLRLFLDVQEDITVVGEAADGAEALELAQAERPDVVVMDLVMPRMDGVEATRLVRETCPEVKVLVLSSFSDDERVLPALRAGADGYLTKETEPARLADSLRALHSGEPVFCPEIVRRLARQVVSSNRRPEGTVTILFTDIEGSTPLVERLGDEAARRLFAAHDDLIRTAAASYDGLEVDQDGDAFMLAFSSARRAVGCAVAIQQDLRAREARLPDVRVRIGLNTGDVIAEEDRYFGRAVFVASRVAGHANGGEILVSELTKALVDGSGELRFRDRGEHLLKGLRGSHRLYEVEWATSGSDPGGRGDPPAGSAGSDPLTEREREVLRLLAEGLQNKAIALELSISEKTVKTHVSNILAKLQLADRTQAALYAVREGLVHLES